MVQQRRHQLGILGQPPDLLFCLLPSFVVWHQELSEQQLQLVHDYWPLPVRTPSLLLRRGLSSRCNNTPEHKIAHKSPPASEEERQESGRRPPIAVSQSEPLRASCLVPLGRRPKVEVTQDRRHKLPTGFRRERGREDAVPQSNSTKWIRSGCSGSMGTATLGRGFVITHARRRPRVGKFMHIGESWPLSPQSNQGYGSVPLPLVIRGNANRGYGSVSIFDSRFRATSHITVYGILLSIWSSPWIF